MPVGSPVAEIREAYRRLVQENLWNKETFAELKEAYEVLTAPARRNEYDKSTFGETFAFAETTSIPATSEISLLQNARHCPMGAASQCPAINARVPLQETYCPECGFLLASLSDQEFEPVAATDPATQIRLEGEAGDTYLLHRGANSVGRESADVILSEKTVSRHHAQIEIDENRSVRVEDLGSTNGTRINGQTLLPRSARPARDGEYIQFGSVELRLFVPNPDAPEAEGAADAAEAPAVSEAAARLVAVRGDVSKTISLIPGVTTFGRRADNTVVLRDDPYVSGSHARITAEGDDFQLTDLGSTNGTLVNSEPLAPNQPRDLAVGDEIVIGGSAYRFERLDVETPPSAQVEDDIDIAERDPSAELAESEPREESEPEANELEQTEE